MSVRVVVRDVILAILALLFISPLLFMLVTSFKTRSKATAVPPTWWPAEPSIEPTIGAYRSILTASGTPVLRWFVNSLLAATANSALVVMTRCAGRLPIGAHAVPRPVRRVRASSRPCSCRP